LSRLKNGKAPGNSNILSEMLKVGCDNNEFVSLLVDLLQSVWKERKVTKEWIDIPIPMKGDFKNCYT